MSPRLSTMGRQLLEAARDGRLKQRVSHHGSYDVLEVPKEPPPTFDEAYAKYLAAPNITVSSFKAALNKGLIAQDGPLDAERWATYTPTAKGHAVLRDQEV